MDAVNNTSEGSLVHIYGVSSMAPGTDNTSTYPYPAQEQDPITEFVQVYSIPFLCTFGLVGNSLASFVFLQRSLRNSSSSIFLATRGFSDNGFLSTLFIIWLSRTFNLQLGAAAGVCRVIVFLTYVCGCVSVWLVVFVTIENYIRICKPFIVNRVCKTKAAKVAVVVLWIITIGIYNFPFWAMTGDTCSPYPQYLNLVQAFVYADTILTLVIPLICITIFMTAIVCDLVKSFNRRGRLRAPTVKHIKNPMAKVTRMLLSVSVSFFILNLPSHIIRLKLMITTFIDENAYPTETDHVYQQLLLMVSYMSLAINICLYLIFGSKFRSVLILSVCGNEQSRCRRSCMRQKYTHDACETRNLTTEPVTNETKAVIMTNGHGE